MVNNHYHKHTLKNGLTLLTIPMPQVRSVSGLLMVGVGSRHEEKRINGLSHFLEHMAFKGTKKRPSALQIAEEIDSIGALNNAYTGKEYTGYYMKAAAKHLPLAADILSDIVLYSLFRPKEIEKEKGVILEEINMYEDMPMWNVDKIFEKLLYKDTSLGRKILGEKENIRGIKRDDFVKYIGNWYSPGNAVFAVAGGIRELAVKKLVEEKFEAWGNIGPISRIGPILEKQEEPAVSVENKKTEQAHLVLGVRAYKREHPKRYALGVLATILGGGMSSRLFHEVREKRGLAYYISAYAQKYGDAGYFAARAGVDKRKIEEAIKVILEEFGKIRDIRITKRELEKAKENLKGHLILELEDSYEVASLYASSFLLRGKVETPEEVIRKINLVTAKQVQEAAKEIFTGEKLNLAVIGEFEDEERFNKLLKL